MFELNKRQIQKGFGEGANKAVKQKKSARTFFVFMHFCAFLSREDDNPSSVN